MKEKEAREKLQDTIDVLGFEIAETESRRDKYKDALDDIIIAAIYTHTESDVAIELARIAFQALNEKPPMAWGDT